MPCELRIAKYFTTILAQGRTMSAKAIHAVLTLITGVAFGSLWLRVFWNTAPRVPIVVLAAPIAVGLVGLSHWVAYDFSLGHWAGDVSLAQAVCNLWVAAALLRRRTSAAPRTP